MDKLKAILIRHEGLKLKPYRDTSNNLTIGVGRNLDGIGLSESEVDLLLNNDILRVTTSAAATFYWYQFLSDARKDVVVSMIFNVGLEKFQNFKKMIAAIEEGDFSLAATEMLDSAWAPQVGQRAIELSEIMKTGSYS